MSRDGPAGAYERERDRLRDALVVALSPNTPLEDRYVTWLCRQDNETMETILGMITRGRDCRLG